MSCMANLKRNKTEQKPQKYLNLAFQQAEINLGSTSTNPSEAVLLKNGSVISDTPLNADIRQNSL